MLFRSFPEHVATLSTRQSRHTRTIRTDRLCCALAKVLTPGMATAAAKIVATGVVMVYNFVTRKLFLEQKDEPGKA